MIILPDDYDLDNPDDVQKLLALVSAVISSYKQQTGQ